MPFDLFVPEHAIDYDEVFSRGGRNFGDEDFAIFRCPGCGKVYLIDYEVDIVFTDGRDLAARVPISGRGFGCVGCGAAMPQHPLGREMRDETRVTWDQLRDSDWGWAATIETMLRNEKRMKQELGREP